VACVSDYIIINIIKLIGFLLRANTTFLLVHTYCVSSSIQFLFLQQLPLFRAHKIIVSVNVWLLIVGNKRCFSALITLSFFLIITNSWMKCFTQISGCSKARNLEKWVFRENKKKAISFIFVLHGNYNITNLSMRFWPRILLSRIVKKEWNVFNFDWVSWKLNVYLLKM
jgi:hypothetical protein